MTFLACYLNMSSASGGTQLLFAVGTLKVFILFSLRKPHGLELKPVFYRFPHREKTGKLFLAGHNVAGKQPEQSVKIEKVSQKDQGPE